MFRFTRRTTRGRLLVASVALGSALALGACAEEGPGPETGADVEDVGQDGEVGDDADAGFDEQAFFEDPMEFAGQEVTVSGNVSEVLTENAFRLGGEDIGGNPLLVVNAQTMADLEEGANVQVTGTVREFQIAEFEDEFGLGFDADTFGAFEGQAAIVASNVSQQVPEEQNS